MKRVLSIIILVFGISLISFSNMSEVVKDNIVNPFLSIGDKNEYIFYVNGDLNLIDNENFKEELVEMLVNDLELVMFQPATETNNKIVITISSNYYDYINKLPIITSKKTGLNESTFYNIGKDPNIYIPLSTESYEIQIFNENIKYDYSFVNQDTIVLSNNEISVDTIKDVFNAKFKDVDLDIRSTINHPYFENYFLSSLILVIVLSLVCIVPIVFELFSKSKLLAVKKLEGSTIFEILFRYLFKLICTFLLMCLIVIILLYSTIKSTVAFEIFMKDFILYSIISISVLILLHIIIYFLIFQITINELVKGRTFLKKSIDFLYLIRIISAVLFLFIFTQFINQSKIFIIGNSTRIEKEVLYKNNYRLQIKSSNLNDAMEWMNTKEYDRFKSFMIKSYGQFEFIDITPFYHEGNVEINESCRFYSVSENYFKGIENTTSVSYYTSKDKNTFDECKNAYEVWDDVDISEYIYIENSRLKVKKYTNFSANEFDSRYGHKLSTELYDIYHVRQIEDIELLHNDSYFITEKDPEYILAEIKNNFGIDYFQIESILDEYQTEKELFLNKYKFTLLLFLFSSLLLLFISIRTAKLIFKSEEQYITSMSNEGHLVLKINLKLLRFHLFWYVILGVILTLIKVSNIKVIVITSSIIMIVDGVILGYLSKNKIK